MSAKSPCRLLLLAGEQQCQTRAENHDVVGELLPILSGSECAVMHIGVAEVHGHEVRTEGSQTRARQTAGDERGQQGSAERGLPKVLGSSLATAGTPVAAICCRYA